MLKSGPENKIRAFEEKLFPGSYYERVLRAMDTIAKGGIVVMTDNEDRENEGDLVFAASDVTPEKINFMAKEARGLICLALHRDIAESLNLSLMVPESENGTGQKTAFTVSIEAKTGVTTGISAFDRCRTIQVAVNPDAKPGDIISPGHIFPLIARDGGVLEREGHTEGSVDLVTLAGKRAASVICEILRDDGKMARTADLEIFCEKYQLPAVSVDDIKKYMMHH